MSFLQEISLCTYFKYLEGNRIEDEGCRYFSQGKWPMLQTANLSIPCFNHRKIKLNHCHSFADHPKIQQVLFRV